MMIADCIYFLTVSLGVYPTEAVQKCIMFVYNCPKYLVEKSHL